MKAACDCCEGVHAQTPQAYENRPGLARLHYRVGTWSSFYQSMRARLSGADYPELAHLSARAADDPALALLDAWACVGEVLSFYQERIANEGYLRTATERRSVLELARLVGYRLRPGVAASVYLAYTVEAGAAPATIPAGSRVNSIPAPGEQMQTFETSQQISARYEFNALKPRMTRPHAPDTISVQGKLYLKGTATGLKTNDIVLVDFGDASAYPSVQRVRTVMPDEQAARTLVTLFTNPVPSARASVPSTAMQEPARNSFKTLVAALELPPSVPPASSQDLRRNAALTFAPQADIYPRLVAAMLPAVGTQLYAGLATLGAAAPRIRVHALRRAVPMFGHNTPPKPIFQGPLVIGYEEWALAGDARQIELDAVYDQIVPDSFALVERTGQSPVLAKVLSVQPVSVAKYGMAARVTRLTIDQDWAPPSDGEVDLSILRGATVHVVSEELALAEQPVEESVSGSDIELDRLYDGLESGRWLIITGERLVEGSAGVMGAELLMLAGVSGSAPQAGDVPHTSIRIAVESGAGLAYEYKRDTVTIHANVAHATHGETRAEVLGSGNGAMAWQTFVLRQPPLTFVSAQSASGVASTLEVRVNKVQWHEADSVAGLTPQDRRFVTQTDDQGRTSVKFGDGVLGARLPTGAENIEARYRNGIGQDGNVNSEQISLLATKPLGVKAVINPMPASGGANREERDQARRHAPLAVTALDRLVSTQDYADFARLFGGVGKASAARLATGFGHTVVVTIAGAGDIPIDPTSDLMRNLRAALRHYGDPFVPVVLKVRELQALVIEARVKVLPDYDWEFVEPDLRAALLEAFGFERRELGQGVVVSEVLAAIHQVAGVAYVDLERLERIGTEAAIDAFVTAQQVGDIDGRPASIRHGEVLQAQLIYLQPNVPDTLILNEVLS